MFQADCSVSDMYKLGYRRQILDFGLFHYSRFEREYMRNFEDRQ